jgi:hypothetical protein
MKIPPAHNRQQPPKTLKKLDYRLQDEYYLFPAQMLITGKLSETTREIVVVLRVFYRNPRGRSLKNRLMIIDYALLNLLRRGKGSRGKA